MFKINIIITSIIIVLNCIIFVVAESQIDFLMEMALDKIAYLPFAYSVDLVSITLLIK